MMQKKYELAKQYLIENIGNLIFAGDVYYDAMHNTWNAKILSKTPYGIIILGEIKFDSDMQIIKVPPKNTILKILK